MNYLATTFTIPMTNHVDDIEIVAREFLPRDGCERVVKSWAVCWLGNVWTKEGRWEFEPMPSSRDADFLHRARYASFEGAMVAARLAVSNINRMRRRQARKR